ncbi:MAG TPA: COX15/CtaA family protein, partial [Chitinophagales bacterium]|nr:COX15/CtaA family protein [Chitinophagales bacterium]
MDSVSSKKQLGYLLIIALGIIYLQVIIGGITRLTGSGLSITEWKVVTGTLPPLSEQAWQTEFDKYRQTPQYE